MRRIVEPCAAGGHSDPDRDPDRDHDPDRDPDRDRDRYPDRDHDPLNPALSIATFIFVS